MSFVVNFFKGVAIGAGAIIPGVSSGVICVIMGIYEKLLDCALGLFRDFKNNVKFLAPVAFGGVIGVVLFGKVLSFLLNTFPFQVSFLFIGLIVGSVPALIKDVSKNHRFRLSYGFYLLAAVGVGLAMVALERSGVGGVGVGGVGGGDAVGGAVGGGAVAGTGEAGTGWARLFAAGVCMAVGVVVPGVSSTVILMLAGAYGIYLDSIANMYLPTLTPIVCGLLVGSLICMRAIKYLLENYYAQTFYSIIGFTIGSIFVLYPGFTFNVNGFVSILCLIIGVCITNCLE